MLENSRFTVDKWNDLRFVPKTDVGKAGDLNGRGRRVYITNAGIVNNLTATKCFMVILHRFHGKIADLEMRRVPPYSHVFEREYPDNVLYYGELELEYRLVTTGSTYYSLTGKIKVEDNFFDSDKVTNTTEFKLLDSSLQSLTLMNSTVDRLNAVELLVRGTPGRIAGFDTNGKLSSSSYVTIDLFKLDKLPIQTYRDNALLTTKNGQIIATGYDVSIVTDLRDSVALLKAKVTAIEEKLKTGNTETPGTPGTLKEGDRVKLINSQPGYFTADDAALGVKQVNTLSAGEYYIYNIISTGQVNITKTQGIAGTWIRSSSVLTKI